MLKKCHKCRVTFETDEFFCSECGSILFEVVQKEIPKQQPETEKEPAFIEYVKNEAKAEKFQTGARMFLAGSALSVLVMVYIFAEIVYTANIVLNQFFAIIPTVAVVVLSAIFLVFVAFKLIPYIAVKKISKQAVTYKLEGEFANLTELFKVKLKKWIGILKIYSLVSAIMLTFFPGVISLIISPATLLSVSFAQGIIFIFNTVCMYFLAYAFSVFKRSIDNDKCRNVKQLHQGMRLLNVHYVISLIINSIILLLCVSVYMGKMGKLPMSSAIFDWYGYNSTQPIWIFAASALADLFRVIAAIKIISCVKNLSYTLKIVGEPL